MGKSLPARNVLRTKEVNASAYDGGAKSVVSMKTCLRMTSMAPEGRRLWFVSTGQHSGAANGERRDDNAQSGNSENTPPSTSAISEAEFAAPRANSVPISPEAEPFGA